MNQFMITNFFQMYILVCLVLISPAGYGESINLGWESQVRSFDPRNNLDANSQYLENLIHCSLVEFDENGATTLSLASTATWSDDGLQLTLKIKDNIRFANGAPVTVKDVAATYKSLVSQPTFARHSPFKSIKSVQVRANKSVVFSLTQPDATFLTNLVVGILPADAAKKAKSVDYKTPGCGPYMVDSKSIGTIALKANPHYHLGAPPQIKEVNIKIVKSEKTRLAKLQTGELDIVQNLISRDLIRTIEKKYPKLKVQKKPALKTTYIGFNVRDDILKHRLVRQAITHAIDREPIIRHILGGLALPAITLIPPSSPYFNKKIKPLSFDVAAANQLLDQAGFPRKGPYRFTISYKTTTDSTRLQIAKAIASQLKKVGIKVKVESMEWGRFSQDVAAGRVQMWGLKWIGFKDPDIYRYAFATESIPPNGGNRGYYSNPQLDQLLAQGRKTSPPEQRRNTYDKVQEIISRDCPYVFLWHEENFVVLNKEVKGFQLYADGRFSSLTKVTKK